MNWKIAICTGLTALACGQNAVGHSGGVSIARDLERRIVTGMSCDDVRMNLGRPATSFQYRAVPGPTWTYNIEGLPPGNFLFEVTFDASCKVTSTTERFIPGGG